ncbi:YceD family protein [Paracoccus denitrificans]|jgi:hypothetical protein|uniref:DUF177 domain-containing protein n=1 Tax=Paracoccus denitrificans (strain Pd 1222) TaxID=318586 RepID=A1B396_PARDP|nr:DUF177 domain-containing protein [Paracoccus denitrificans]ABL69990.1 protein of unknown function DUF177 [Paracoccus denitrificans PD1222]MBB4627072.1 hypothetical protein [Paracoccus denitrificans]MCU7428457.1 DUF177 domain-containing protein [Paracoccus denitrificans]QAR25375.1 DUF177 domain-containing protein [Paracoccus denitrificans]UPV94260.1 DUF177 domain-containing protein [Paracoccus denitrificans]
MTDSKTPQTRFRVAHLNPRQPTDFALAPAAPAREALAAELGLNALPRLRFSGRIRALASDAWEVTGELAARVVQPCVVTLAPVATDLREEVHRVFSPHVGTPEDDEVEMPDEELEPLGQFIDVEAIMTEALVLALPLYPRAEDAALDAPEPAPEEPARKPFAGLADLLKQPKNDS